MNRLLRRFCSLLAPVALAGLGTAQAEVKPHALFSDGAVLQRNIPIPVWGTAKDGEKVKVTYLDRTAETVAKDGAWRVDLQPLATGQGVLTIEGENKVEVKEVLVGEVWLASGQSNMEWPLQATENADSAIAGATDDMIRLFTVPRRGTPEPQRDVDAHWEHCTPDTARNFSAVAYFFAKNLHEKLGVPVGIISTNVGGTTAEAWTSKATLEADPTLKPLASHPDASGLYNAMIAPLVPYGIRGAIWYQGESNAGRAAEYRRLFPSMIKNWRDEWKEGDFPFLFVQLAPFMNRTAEPVEEGWADLREAQFLTLVNSPNTGMAVITDLGDEKDIHPRKKAEVGYRLSLAARKLACGHNDLVFSGPTFATATAEGDKMIVDFDNVGGGLVANDGGDLKGFALAGPDGKFHHAKAEIQGSKVVVTSPDVKEPKAVRFGWMNFPIVNFTNKEGLPATPFRSDVPRD